MILAIIHANCGSFCIGLSPESKVYAVLLYGLNVHKYVRYNLVENSQGGVTMNKTILRKLAVLMAFVMLFTSIPMTSLAAQESYVLVPERSIYTSDMESGAFYLGSETAEFNENEKGPYMLKVVRNGAADNKATVRLHMLDVTAKYGEDYTVRISDASIIEKGAQNTDTSKSITEVMSSDKVTEYNYSDAVVEGLITAENQLEKEEQEEDLKEAKAYLNDETASSSDAKSDDADASLSEAASKESVKPAEEEDASYSETGLDGAVINDATFSEASDIEPIKVTSALQHLSLAQLKELQTGITNDKTSMSYDSESDLLGINMDSFGEENVEDPYFSESREEILRQLSSTYIDIDFKPGVSERYVKIEVIDDDKSQGNLQAEFSLGSVDDSTVSKEYSTFIMIINDDEEYVPDTVQFTSAEYVPANGYVSVSVERKGNLNELASVMIDTESITAEPETQFSEVHAANYFVYGVKERAVKIPIVSTGLTEDVQFKVKLQEPVGCELGDITEAICTIRPTDKSFETTLETTSQSDPSAAPLKAAAAGEEQDEIEHDYDVISDDGTANLEGMEWWDIILDRNAKVYGDDMKQQVVWAHADAAGSVIYRSDIKAWELYTRRHIAQSGAATRVGFNFHPWETRLDWNGMQVEWKKENGGSELKVADVGVYTYVKAEPPSIDHYGRSVKNWDRRTDCYWSSTKYNAVWEFGLFIETARWGFPHLYIYGITPIKRPFEITLETSQPFTLITDQGKRIKNSESSNKVYQNAHLTKIVEGKTNNTITTVSGHTVTVGLSDEDNPIAYIAGLEVVDSSGKGMNIWSAKDNEYPSSATFELTNNLLQRIDKFDALTLEKVKDEAHGFRGNKGKFSIRAIVKNKPAVLKYKEDARCDLVLWDVDDNNVITQKTGKKVGDMTYYTYGMGDCVRYQANIKDEYKTEYVYSGIDFLVEGQPTRTTWVMEGDLGKGYVKEIADKQEQTIRANLSKWDNRVVVRIAKTDDKLFDHDKGFFADALSVEASGNYLYYIIESDPQKIPGRVFVLTAYLKDGCAGMIPVWQDINHKEKYSQNTYYFDGSQKKEENVVLLTAERGVQQKYSITGKVYYDVAQLGETKTLEGWIPASGLPILVDVTHYGITDKDGVFSTTEFAGIKNYYVKTRIGTDRDAVYRSVKLENKKDIDIGRIVFNTQSKTHPRFTFLKGNSFDRKTGILIADSIKYIVIGNESTVSGTLLSAGTTDTNEFGNDFTYTYMQKGKSMTAKESVKRVEFVVYGDHTEKAVYKIDAPSEGTDPKKWSSPYVFAKGHYLDYKAGDLLFARVVTDRKTDDGTDVISNEVTYPPINTGMSFVEEAPTSPEFTKLVVPSTDGFKLPVIGNLTTMLSLSYLNLGIETTVDNGIRVNFGASFPAAGSHFDKYGLAKSDTKVMYGVSDLGEGMETLINKLKEAQDAEESGTTGIGIKAWGFRPIVGLYFEFQAQMVPTQKGGYKLVYRFLGGGAYGGFIGTFRYTHYFLVGGVPTYVGGDLEAQMLLEWGAAYDKEKTPKEWEITRLDQDFLTKLTSNTHTNFILRMIFYVNAYAGVGICKTLGVRGGFAFSFHFINNKAITKNYPKVNPTGFYATGHLKFWADVIVFSIPVPVLSFTKDQPWRAGYYADIKVGETDEETTSEIDETSQELGDIIPKARLSKESTFVGHFDTRESIRGLDSEWEGSITGRNIICHSYDDASQKLVEVQTPSNASKKIMMTYLEDDFDRESVDRTRLMYSIYDEDQETWSDPEPIDPSDTTADFSPYVCDRGGDVLITWASGKDPMTNIGTASYSEILKSQQIFTARFDKSDKKIKDITQITDDGYMNANPIAVYDESTGKTFVFYLKSYVGDITTSEDLIKYSMPQTNKAEIAYRIYDDSADGGKGKWLTDEYLDGELPDDPVKAEIVKAQLNGQRFVASPISEFGINNPVISDYAIIEASLHDNIDEMVRKICTLADVDYNELKNADEAAESKLDAYVASHQDVVKNLYKTKKNVGIYAYVVDTDNNMSTTEDQEIYLQTFDTATHTFGTPIRITNNAVGENHIKLVQNDDTAYMFWIENGQTDAQTQMNSSESTINYVDLSELIGIDDEAGRQELIQSIGSMYAGCDRSGSSLTDYSVFADSNDNLHLAWAESTEDKLDGSEEEYIPQQDVYVASLMRNAADSVTGKATPSGWSNGIRITNSKEINGLPQFSELSDGSLLMMSNSYSVDLASETTELIDSNLKETVMTSAGIAVPTSVSTVRLPNKAGEQFEVTVEFTNLGNEQTESFDYKLQICADGKTIDGMTKAGTVARPLVVNEKRTVTETFTMTEDALKNINKLSLYAETKPKRGPDYTSKKTLSFGSQLPNYNIANVSINQEGNNFRITGTVEDAGVVAGSSQDVLVIADDGDNILAKIPLTGMVSGKQDFNRLIPITKDTAYYRYAHLMLQVKRGTQECSSPQYVRGYMKQPSGLTIEGATNDQIILTVGQSLTLNGSFDESVYFGEVKPIYAVEDGLVARLDGDVITGVASGTTQLFMTVDQCGGNKTVTVIINDAPVPKRKGGSSGGSLIPAEDGPANAVQLSGDWKQDEDGTWSFIGKDGKPVTGWGKTRSGTDTEYYHFNENGVMDTGWYLDTDGSWYYLHEVKDRREGAMDRGWHLDSRDCNWYYLDPKTGKMKVGWVYDNGNYYYMSEDKNGATWVRMKAGYWTYSGKGRPYGSMYRKEKTPDNKTVGGDGALVIDAGS